MKKIKVEMPQKNKESQDVFEKGQKIGRDWFDSATRKDSSSINSRI
jgi:hypothetical protein